MKKNYIRQIQTRAFFIGYGLALALSFWQLKYGLGLIVGVAVSQINFLLHQNYVDELLFREHFTLSLFIFNAMINYGLMILAFLTAIVWPHLFSIYMVALGLVMIKLVVYVSEVKLKKKGENHDRSH